LKYLSFVESPLHQMVVVKNCDVETMRGVDDDDDDDDGYNAKTFLLSTI